MAMNVKRCLHFGGHTESENVPTSPSSILLSYTYLRRTVTTARLSEYKKYKILENRFVLK